MNTSTQIHQQTDPTNNQLGNSSDCSSLGPMTDPLEQAVEDGPCAELAPAQCLWTTEASGSVQLRMDELCQEQPITVHQMFIASIQKFGNLSALAIKRGNKWEKVSFSEYYQLCYIAAKSFLKVIWVTSFFSSYTLTEHFIRNI
ncbi:long-chain-fatty-acid--CoA ligase ACSBG1-like [Myxocyprinus asiaticus]|uniref:long-chain-fatty-acid--CoA ligase ACSBG1-like n=1 Tax=Myxocyprinus asiaticus TaxID=70543 RepID=UPI0022234FA0|nr:long-chain-fatty-acid--CoA ligase ACSBG1-like [Myxocyprinus asiaticus]